MIAAAIAAQLGDAQPAENGNWRCKCPICGKASLSLKDNPKKSRVKLLIHCWSGCEGKTVRAEIRGRGLLNGSGENGAAPPETDAERTAREAEEAARQQVRIAAALDMWRQSLPADVNGMIRKYLASRLLLPKPIPAALRYIGEAYHPTEKIKYPAMVGLVQHETLGAIGIHLTALNVLDAASKLTITDRKWSLGTIKGGAIRLFELNGPELALGEGIEDCLSFEQEMHIPAWAVVGQTGLVNFEPPLEAVSTLVLLEDQDDAGRKAVAKAAERFTKLGYTVRIARPLKGKDINEALMRIGPDNGPICNILDYVGDWYSKCLASSDGRTLCNLANTLLALREDPSCRDLFRYDGMLGAPLLTRLHTEASHQSEPKYPRPITDTDITALQEWLQLAGLPTVSHDTVYQAVELVAREHTFHPVKNYLESLAWDGVDRLEDWLSDCFGVEKTEYTMAVGRMFLIGMVARIYQPGCQADYMLILEGTQGIRKSSACRVLADRWFSDDLPENVSAKDTKLHLRGKWLVEIAELHQFNRAETTALKAFLTRREDQYRPPYGRKEVFRPRQNLFVGTTNKKVYLQDSTGGRRFWPVLTTEIDIETLILQRDQLFAEAVVRYRRGEPWWPHAEFEAKHMTPEQEMRFESDPWDDPIARFLDEKPNYAAAYPHGRVTVWEVARALFIETPRIGTADQRRITAILEQLGWIRGKRNTADGKRWWVPTQQWIDTH